MRIGSRLAAPKTKTYGAETDPTARDITAAISVVANGPPSRWTMLMALFALGIRSFGTDAYAAETDGMFMVP
jgi:hypothetical protein